MSSEKYKLTVNVTGLLGSMTHVTVFDGKFAEVATGYGSISVEAIKGIYTVRLETNEEVVDQTVIVDKEISRSIDAPLGASSIPIAGYKSSHEYYTNPSIQWSTQQTFGGPSKPGGLFILFRYPNKDSWDLSEHQGLGEDFILADGNHQLVCELKGQAVREDMNVGMLVFSANLDPGMYYLQYFGKPSREIPLFVYKGYQTQLFMTFVDVPLFQTMCISMTHLGTLFDPQDPNLFLIDGITQKFANGIYYVPEDVLQLLAQDKWENPMLGIIAAFVCLKSPTSQRDQLLRTIIRNIENIIFIGSPPSPDLKALKILSALYFNETIDQVTLELPCMFFPALKEVIKLSADYPSIILDDSPLEQVETLVYGDSVWTSYLPIHFVENKPLTRSVPVVNLKRKYRPTTITEEPAINKVSVMINELLTSKRDIKSLNVAQIARSLNVSTNTVSKALRKIMAETTLSDENKTMLTSIGSNILTKAIKGEFQLFKSNSNNPASQTNLENQ
jgi:hypothetical protein